MQARVVAGGAALIVGSGLWVPIRSVADTAGVPASLVQELTVRGSDNWTVIGLVAICLGCTLWGIVQPRHSVWSLVAALAALPLVPICLACPQQIAHWDGMAPDGQLIGGVVSNELAAAVWVFGLGTALYLVALVLEARQVRRRTTGPSALASGSAPLSARRQPPAARRVGGLPAADPAE
ncbi:hypothetical protein [Buchananella hordeovulneris]|uniref:hypothetical protein n=1 Tax=Buchananella hordeovulneris TaxID=52770 RepID=UPI001160EC6F|nr:hypothetical protein [Buchananella hordeovulneris]